MVPLANRSRYQIKGEEETNMSFIDAQGYLDPGNWDNSWLNSLTDDGSMPGDLVFGFFA